MKNSKWLRSALLGGVAVSVMATGAQAGELSDLKAQLEALQSRVNTIETAPRAAALPEGAALLTASRGQGSLASFGNEAAKDAANISADRGFTIAINPTADLPAPVTEITVYGYAKGVATWTSETTAGNAARLNMAGYNGANESNQWAITGRQSRFGIKAKTDTAIGQIRSVVEGDFASGANVLRLRHGYGEWDMTDNWTFVAGQTWYVNSLLPFGVSTVDFTGPAGPTYSRGGQVALKYSNGPLSGAIGVMQPLAAAGADYFDIGMRLGYTAGGGHEFFFGAAIGDDDTGGTNKTSWEVGGGANLRLGEIATITTAIIYGKGVQAGNLLTSNGFGTKDANGNPTKMWGAGVGVSFTVSEATTVNAQFGYVDQAVGQGTASGSAGAATCSGTRSSACVDDLMTVHANIMWRPVKQMRLGWEIAWGRNDYYNAKSNSAVKGLFGAWFFF